MRKRSTRASWPGRSSAATPFNYIRNSVKITIDAYDGTMHFYVADPDDPIIRAYEGIFPAMFEPLTAMPSDLRTHVRVPEELFNVQTRVFGRYHVTDTLQFFRKDDLWTVPTGTSSEQTLPSRGVLRRDAPAGRDGRGVPAPPADGADQPAEHDRLGRRAQRRGELWLDAGLSVPGRHDDLRACADRGAYRPGSGHQRPDLAVEPVRQQGHPRQSHRAAAGRRPDLPPAGLPAVDRLGLPGVHADRRRLAAAGRLERDARRRAAAAAGGRGRRAAGADPDARHPDRRRARAPRRRLPRRRQPVADPERGAADRRARADRVSRTPTSSSPRRRCATATSPATAPRSRWCRPRSSDSRSSHPDSRVPSPGTSTSPAP